MTDDAVLSAEARLLMNPTLGGAKWEFTTDPAPIAIEPLNPVSAKKHFLEVFASLRMEEKGGVSGRP